jgi:hypothetical protein
MLYKFKKIKVVGRSINLIRGMLEEASEKYTFEVKWTDRDYRDQKKSFSDADKETARKKANTFADKLEKNDSKDKYGNIRGRVRVAMKESDVLDKKTPTEEELATKYGVDISTVREAVRVGTGVEYEHITMKQQKQLEQVKELEAENERLRQALEQIAKKHPGYGGVGDIARRALRHND